MITLRYADRKLFFTCPHLGIKRKELIGIGSLLLGVFFLLKLSWRKWSDPQIDFGREVYIPWQLASGAKWLKDVDDLYGPLSRFIDAGLFRLFGPGIMILATANIVTYLVILALLYFLFRKAWGIAASLMSCGVFISVFSFSQFTITSNYNFVTPYSQQVLHGFLLSLVGILALKNWVNNQTLLNSLWVGFVLGLSVLLKPEFILANGILFFGTLIFKTRHLGFPEFSRLFFVGVASCVPMLMFWIYFCSYLSISEAFFASNHAWINGLSIWKDKLTAHLLDSFSGMDKPIPNLLIHLRATAYALLVIGSIFAISLVSVRIKFNVVRWLVLLLGLEVIMHYSLFVINWVNVGQCLLGLLLIYALYTVFKTIITKSASANTDVLLYRLLLLLLASALMIRMILNGRIFQYGFIQSAIAGMVITAVLISEIQVILRLDGASKWFSRFGVGVLISCGCISLITQSKNLLDAKTLSIGRGVDQFYSFPAGISGAGHIVDQVSTLLLDDKKILNLIVYPEGIMINYLARKKSPVPDLLFYSSHEIEHQIVLRLKDNSPDIVIGLSRDLSEYGVSSFGAKGESGEEFIKWLNNQYTISTTLGDDPLKPKQVAGIIYTRIK